MMLLSLPLLGQAQSDPPAEPGDVQRLINVIEDPQGREALLQDLRLLLEAEAAAPAIAEEQTTPAADVVDALRGFVSGVWEALTTLDPVQLLVSIGITLLIVAAAVIARALVLRLLRRLYRRITASAAALPADMREETQLDMTDRREARDSGLPRVVSRLVTLIVLVLAAALIADSWGAGLAALLATDLGARIAAAGLSVGVILIITVVAWHLAGLGVARLLLLANGSKASERTGRRVHSLVPLLRSVVHAIIGVLAALLILAELGVNIAPLLAGAGIIGLAIGFGAQTLVKDIITGVTIMLEDGATVGDVIEVAGHFGVVEDMRIRVLQLRDAAGVVHLVPYSEVAAITNHTKDFSYFMTEVGVAYREDTDEVSALLVEVAEQMRQDPVIGGEILEPMEIMGVDKFADSAVVIKARLKTVPGRQWAIGRAFNRRMKYAFDERGIEIPFPHTTVYFGEPKEGTAPPAHLAIERVSKDLAALVAAPSRN